MVERSIKCIMHYFLSEPECFHMQKQGQLMLPTSVPRVREGPLYSLLETSVSVGNKASQTRGCRRRLHKETISSRSKFHIDICFTRFLFSLLVYAFKCKCVVYSCDSPTGVCSFNSCFVSFRRFGCLFVFVFLSFDQFIDNRFCFRFRTLLSPDVACFLHTFHKT